MTQTEILQAAWGVLQSKAQITALFEEMDATPDQVSKALARLDTVGQQHEAKRRAAKIKSICQQMQIYGIRPEELIEYLSQPQKRRRKARSAPKLETIPTAAA